MTENQIPDVELPDGVADATEWQIHPDDTYRCIMGERREVGLTYVDGSPVGPHYVEAHAVQEADGSVVEACVRAQVNAWNLNRYADWDTMLTPEKAREQADSCRADAQTLLILAEAYSKAAADVERWTPEQGVSR